MKIARVAMLGVALAAGGAAAYLASGSKPAPAPQVVQAPASMQTEEVLVAAKELNFGAEVGDGDISWQVWAQHRRGQGHIHPQQREPERARGPQGLARSCAALSWRANRSAATFSSRDRRRG